MSYSEVRNMPVRYRRWFLDRLVKEFKDQSEARKKNQNSNDSDRRSILQDIPMGEMNPAARQIREKKFK